MLEMMTRETIISMVAVSPVKNNGEVRQKGRIAAIINEIKAEEGFFYLSDYVQKFPPATVQGVFSILRTWGVIRSVSGFCIDQHGNRKMERGKYIKA